MKEHILLYGDADTLKHVAEKYRDDTARVELREFRAFRKEKESADRVVMTREHRAVREFYESLGMPVELDLREAKPSLTREEVDDMKHFFQKKSAIKLLTGQAPMNSIEANYLLNQHFGPKV